MEVAEVDRATATEADSATATGDRMTYLRGFLMAWGGFCRIPCPYKEWKEEDKPAMLAMFPLIGTIIGGIVSLAGYLLFSIQAGMVLIGALLTGLYFWLTGFIHLDGYMDVSDAIMSRRPRLSDRRRILKDSKVGAFAVIALVLMALIFTTSMMQIGGFFTLDLALGLMAVFTATRVVSAVCVMKCAPINSSQYNKLDVKNNHIVAIVVGLIVVFGLTIIGYTIRGTVALTNILWPAFIAAAIAALVGHLDRSNLKGMNGDISGHMIVIGECVAVTCMAVMW